MLERPDHKSRRETVRSYKYETAPFAEEAFEVNHGATHKKKIHVVCSRCNNGWMNTLETAKRHLKPMMLGEAITLDADAQRQIVEWIALKVLVLEHEPTGKRTPAPIFSRQHRLAFKETRAIPAGMRIWICARGGPRWHDSLVIGAGRFLLSSRSGRNVPPPGPEHNSQAVTWGIRNLLVHTFSITYPYLDARTQWDGPPGSVQLWPSAGGSVSWPPSVFLTDLGCDAVGDQFITLAKSLPRSQ